MPRCWTRGCLSSFWIFPLTPLLMIELTNHLCVCASLLRGLQLYSLINSGLLSWRASAFRNRQLSKCKTPHLLRGLSCCGWPMSSTVLGRSSRSRTCGLAIQCTSTVCFNSWFRLERMQVAAHWAWLWPLAWRRVSPCVPCLQKVSSECVDWNHHLWRWRQERTSTKCCNLSLRWAYAKCSHWWWQVSQVDGHCSGLLLHSWCC